jgi:hypothetical protein
MYDMVLLPFVVGVGHLKTTRFRNRGRGSHNPSGNVDQGKTVFN